MHIWMIINSMVAMVNIWKHIWIRILRLNWKASFGQTSRNNNCLWHSMLGRFIFQHVFIYFGKKMITFIVLNSLHISSYLLLFIIPEVLCFGMDKLFDWRSLLLLLLLLLLFNNFFYIFLSMLQWISFLYWILPL